MSQRIKHLCTHPLSVFAAWMRRRAVPRARGPSRRNCSSAASNKPCTLTPSSRATLGAVMHRAHALEATLGMASVQVKWAVNPKRHSERTRAG